MNVHNSMRNFNNNMYVERKRYKTIANYFRLFPGSQAVQLKHDAWN